MPGEDFVPFGTGLGISFSQTKASHNKPDGFSTERATLGFQCIYVHNSNLNYMHMLQCI